MQTFAFFVYQNGSRVGVQTVAQVDAMVAIVQSAVPAHIASRVVIAATATGAVVTATATAEAPSTIARVNC